MDEDYQGYRFWTPEQGQTVEVVCSGKLLNLPSVPIPLKTDQDVSIPPDAELIGRSVHAFLCQYPDAPQALSLACLLRDGYPHYLADMASQVMMISHKEVDPAYHYRKLNYLKVLALLEPNNANLWMQIAVGFFEVAFFFTEYRHAQRNLTRSMSAFQRVLSLEPLSSQAFSYLAQINLYLGDYPAALRCYRKLLPLVTAPEAAAQVEENIASYTDRPCPAESLALQMEAVGEAQQLYASKSYEEALGQLERLQEQGAVFDELPSSDLWCLLGYARMRCADLGGAMEAFYHALECEPECTVALEAIESMQGGDV